MLDRLPPIQALTDEAEDDVVTAQRRSLVFPRLLQLGQPGLGHFDLDSVRLFLRHTFAMLATYDFRMHAIPAE
jgi:hypothetical protein